jgi:HSP20 family protein
MFSFSRMFRDMDEHFRAVERALQMDPFWDVSTPSHRIAHEKPGKKGAAAATAEDEKQVVAQQQQDRPLSLWGTFTSMPLLDIAERDDAYLINADVPGVRKGEVKVHVDDQHGRKVLTISGERKEEVTKEDKDKGYKSWTRSYGKFSRSLALPENVNADGISAKQEDGVLRITVPKVPTKEKPAAKEVNVQ